MKKVIKELTHSVSNDAYLRAAAILLGIWILLTVVTFNPEAICPIF